MNRTYTDLIRLRSFEERYRYLKLSGKVGDLTFAGSRYLNQVLYRSPEWRRFRREVIIRDNGCDLGMAGFEIEDGILIHHLNPLTIEDVKNRSAKIFDLENVICTSLGTHNAIHYGDESLLPLLPPERSQNDTCPWKR